MPIGLRPGSCRTPYRGHESRDVQTRAEWFQYLRHSFEVRALESTLSAERRDVGRHMLTLSTYLGHSNTADTYCNRELPITVGVTGLGMDAPVARDGAPVYVELGLGPLPAGRELGGGGGELGVGELVEQLRVFQPHTVLVLVGEEVAQHRAARGS